MATMGFCGFKPMLFRRNKSFAFEPLNSSTTPKKFPKAQNEGKGESMQWSFVSGDQLILMMEVHKKILVFRDIMDLAPLNSSASLQEMVITTLEDLQRIYPWIIPRKKVSYIKDNSIDQGLAYFCEALKSIGESWIMNNDCMDYSNYELPSCKDNSNMRQLGETMLATLDCLIKIANDKFDIMEEDDQKKELNFSYSSSLVTPKSVLPESMKYTVRPGGDSPRCTSPLWSLRIQAVGKLNPIDLKRLSYHMSPPHMQKDTSEELVFDLETTEESDRKINDQGKAYKPQAMEEVELAVSPRSFLPQSPKLMETSLPSPPQTQTPTPLNVAMQPSPPPPPAPEFQQSAVAVTMPLLPPPPHQGKADKPQAMEEIELAVSPRSLLPQSPKLMETSLPSPPKTQTPTPLNVAMQPSPPPPPASEFQQSAVAVAMPLLPPPPPSLGSSLAAAAAPPPPPPLMSLKGGSAPAPPPPLMPDGKRGAAPPPPPLGAGRCLRPKATTKLKRSTQLGNLYRTLKGKVEGSSLKGKSSGGRTNAIGAASTGGKQGMADALAEMTKRSSYFQQIEEDVQKYTKQIIELRTSITNFKTIEMTKLIKFHKYVESILENLTDESQVLSRFEGFPSKKLEAIRMAAALYNKLDSVLTELQNWNTVSPVGQLLDKAERYFNKIKTELDALERTKDEESKKFKAHNIEFDFLILLKIKEAMVDVSSNCMELALKERRNDAAIRDSGLNSDGKRKECAKLLWRAFQFAFRVYTFAGGHDDRADKLTKELANEIESDPNQCP